MRENKETMKHLSKSSEETSNLAKLFAEELLKTKPNKEALVVGLIGELGAGKTTFIQSFLRASGVKKRIVSPTFIFSRHYKLPKYPRKSASNLRKSAILSAWHFDLYRLGSPKEIKEVGLGDVMKNPENLVLIEWADKIKGMLPRGIIWIEFKHGAKSNERYLTFNRR
ncbi:MAG: tRNA (adenosine(37)-N6)-threonylcarbamoyltransferase complex ATPase subunit type 1 TsaE [Candidatus Colwellbacteria bacterium]|nr:tRNA (adenosine(37)-N6)-threonylcarbamoyltransferase complex ATPase subunit type 1 TsaE [Candidatus Colwellbacteria bacterium]